MTKKGPHPESERREPGEGAGAREADAAGTPAEAPDAAAAEIARLRAREEELLRALAEMSNVQRRRKQETESAVRHAQESLVRDLLPVLDDFERAIAAIAHDADPAIGAGVSLVRDRLHKILEREGLAPIRSLGTPFDPGLHDAIAQRPAPPGVEPGTVLEESSPGYRLKDRVLRHAKVVVAAPAADPREAAPAAEPAPEAADGDAA